MAENDRDEELTRRYRELAREEPPRALDDAILAASRRAVEARPAPLVAPTGRRRWYVPVAAAAVIVLSAVVTLHMQHEQPDMESSVPQVATAPAARKDETPAAAPPAQMRDEKIAAHPKEADALRAPAEVAKPQPERRQRQAAPAPKPAPSSQPPAGESASTQYALKEPKAAAESRPFTPDPAPAAAAPPPPAADTQIQPAAPAASAESRALGGLRDNKMLAKIEMEPPGKILERIASLRREGRTKEADDLYAEFKRRFPDYRIPDAMREQVVPR